MDEFEIIEQIKQSTYRQSSVIKGVGDDAAVFRPHGSDVVTAVDTFVDNIHFSWNTASPFHIGYRSMSANISDLAAMGAIPAFYLVSVVIPPSMEKADLVHLYDGMKEIASQYKMDLIGGDTVSGRELVVSITVFGYVASHNVRYRSDAKERDIVFVTGTLGDSAAGLQILQEELNLECYDYFVQRYQMPKPRVNFARKLRHIDRVCLNDVTDGIANELNEIATASNVSITIEDECVPVHQGLKQFTEEKQHEWKLYGGEDFELVGTVAAIHWDKVQQIAILLNIPISKIGTVHTKDTNEPQVLLYKEGKTSVIQKDGYRHVSR